MKEFHDGKVGHVWQQPSTLQPFSSKNSSQKPGYDRQISATLKVVDSLEKVNPKDRLYGSLNLDTRVASSGHSAFIPYVSVHNWPTKKAASSKQSNWVFLF